MGGEDTSGLDHGGKWASHEVCNGERCIRQVLGWHLNDEELYHSVWILLCEGVDERHTERIEERDAPQVYASSELPQRQQIAPTRPADCKVKTR